MPLPRAFYLALTPWLTFAVADRSAGIGPVASAVLAAVIGLALCGFELARHRWSLLPAVAAAFFGPLAAFSWAAGGSPPGASLDRPLAAAVLAVVFAVSLVGRPVTCWYTGEDVSQGRAASARWALAFAIIAASGFAGAAVSTSWGPTVFNWLLPILVLGIAVIGSSEPAVAGAPRAARAEEAGVAVVLDGLVRTTSGLRAVPGECDGTTPFS